MKKNIILICFVLFLSITFMSCSLLGMLGFGNSALFCVLPTEIAQQLAPTGLDGGTLDGVDQPNDDANSSKDGLNSAVFMAGIVATIASQGTDLFNAIIKELSSVENLFKDEIFLTYEKNGKPYGVNIKNQSQTCYITYGSVSSKSDTDYSKGDALSQFIYDPRVQDKGPNMSITLDEYGLANKSKSKGARYLWLDIKNDASKQSVGVKAYVEGTEAKFFEGVGGIISYTKSSKLFEIEGVIKGHPLASASSLKPKFRVYGVMGDTHEGAFSAKLEDFGLQYTLSKGDMLKALNISIDPIPFINPTYTFTAALDYQIRNYISMKNIPPKGISDVKINGTLLELTKATVSASSISSNTTGATSFLPSGNLDFTAILKPLLKVGPPNNENSLKYYSNITNNGQWKSYTMNDSALPDKNSFGIVYSN